MRSKKFYIITYKGWLLAVFCFLIDFQGQAQLQDTGSKMTLTTLSYTNAVHSGSTSWVALKLDIEESWHINAQKPSAEFLIGTDLQFENGKFQVREVQFPEGEMQAFSFTSSPIKIYAGSVYIFTQFVVPNNLQPGDYQMKGMLEAQACDDEVCLMPSKIPVSFSLKVVEENTPIQKINQSIFKEAVGAVDPPKENITGIYKESLSVMKSDSAFDGTSPGMYFYKLKDCLKNIEYEESEALKAGLLFNRAQVHDRSIKAMEAYIKNNPGNENAEVIAVLIDSYFAVGNNDKVFELVRQFKKEYEKNKQTFTFNDVRLKDRVDFLLLLSYSAKGTHRKLIAQAWQMVETRDREKPPYYNYSTTIWSQAAEAYSALGQYTNGLQFIEGERKKVEAGTTMEEWAKMYKDFIKFQQIVDEKGYAAANKFLVENRGQFTDKYVLKKFDAKLNYSMLLGTKLPKLVMNDELNEPATGFDNQELDGNVVVLDFWATWCHACREAFPFMKSLYRKYADQGLKMVGVVAPYGYVATYNSGVIRDLGYSEELKHTRELVDDYHLNFPQIMDKSKVNFNHFNVSFLPTIVVIDRKGIVREVGHPSHGKLEQLIKELLDEKYIKN